MGKSRKKTKRAVVTEKELAWFLCQGWTLVVDKRGEFRDKDGKYRVELKAVEA